MAGTKETQRWSQIELDNETSRVARASSRISAEAKTEVSPHVQPLRREPSREWPELFFFFNPHCAYFKDFTSQPSLLLSLLPQSRGPLFKATKSDP
jgi:hypothetical protein